MANHSITRRLLLKAGGRLGLSLPVLASAVPAQAKSGNALVGIRVGESSTDHTRVVFDLSAGAEHQMFTLSEPYRVVIDIKDTRKSAAFANDAVETQLVNGIRSATKDGKHLRVVLDMNGKVRPRSFMLKPDGRSGHRLVVDLHATELSPTPIKTNKQERNKSGKPFVIAIDAGHGGRDPGAIGTRGTREKDISLSLAKKMKSVINQSSGYRAVLTREGDRFIPLRKRVQTARKAEADIFVSLHANSFRSKNAKGASVYALSMRGASSEAARLIAKKENAADLIGGISLDDKDDLIASVLLDLSQTATIQDSLDLGSDVLNQLGRVSKLQKNQVQQAGFAVLKAPDMPSILIETAFLSNPTEERKLRDPKHQHKLAKAVFGGIKAHLKHRQG